MAKFHLIYSIFQLELKRGIKTSRHSRIFLKDLTEIFIIIPNSMQELTGLNFQMNYITIFREKLHGKPFLELDYLKDGLRKKVMEISKLKLKLKI